MGKVKVKSGPLARRPDNSAFKQQRLPAWSPMLTANTVLPFFYFMAMICMVLGVWLLLTVQSTKEIKVSVCVSENCLFICLFSSFLDKWNYCSKQKVCVCKRQRLRERMPFCAIKMGVTEERSEGEQPQFTINSLLSFQVDYTEAETCNICFEKRKNVSNAAESCTCTVVFAIEKAFKVNNL